MKPLLLSALALTLLAPATASYGQQAAKPVPEKVATKESLKRVRGISIEVVDLSPRFLDFYEVAKAATPKERFNIWLSRYGFAAVPPTPEGDEIVKSLLASAWDRYPQILPRLRKGVSAMRPKPEKIVADVAKLLNLKRPAKLRIITYVGGFEDNAYTMMDGGVPVLALPLESPSEFIEMVGRHEATHAVHFLTAGLSEGYERPIARVVLEEGLAMRVAAKLLPDRPATSFTERTPGWLAAADAKRSAIMEGVSAVLDQKDGETVYKYTVGSGSTGTEREAYYVGWIVVGHLLDQGKSYADIARIPEDQMVAVVRSALADMKAK